MDTAEQIHEDEAVYVAPGSDDFEEPPQHRSPPQSKKDLERELHKTQKSAYFAGTLKNLLCQWRSFLRFSRKYKINQWPATEHTMCLFAQYLAFTFKSPDSVRNYLYGIRRLHILANVKPPDLKHVEVKLTFRGLSKIMTKEVKRAQPLTPEILTDMLAYLDMEKETDRIFWGLLLVSFFGMLHKSNLIPGTVQGFDPTRQLTRGHITFKEDILVIKVTWAKNLQNRERLVEIPLFAIPGSPLCPVAALKAILSTPGKEHYPLFGIGKKVAFTYVQFQNKMRRVLRRAGYRSRLFSSHSMRHRGTSWAHRSGAPDSLIQIHGDWGSDCFRRYLTFPLEIRAVVSLKMRQKLFRKSYKKAREGSLVISAGVPL